ncbi:phosphotriesterase-related protein [Pseudonocardia sp. S2-4]|uniref:Phosphotriesterase-related protein n=2 Tax=Pseudonocardia humida TaxID=2800819 RepID=A0ABT1A241_9PSEU|nr:phosphotriesterase-related protein [Pseudonocardia humida]
MHEHVFVLDHEVETNYPGRWDEQERIEDAVTKLEDVAARGVRTIVDLTVLGLGRYVPRVLEVAKRVDVQILVATGLYTYDDVPMFFRFRGPGKLIDGPELLTEFFVRDLTEGIADTGVRAAILKCATDRSGMTPGVERVLRAVAHAHRETGAPISTHTDAGTRRGLEQRAVFREEGVDLERVVIGHCGDSTDLAYLRELMEAGSYIGMDRFGLDLMLPFEDRVATVAALCAEGYAERMVLSHDASCFTHNFDVAKKRELLPRWVYTHLHDDVLPALRERGVTQQQIDRMLIENPKRVLAPR